MRDRRAALGRVAAGDLRGLAGTPILDVGGSPTGKRFSLCAAQCACPSSWMWNACRSASVNPIASAAALTESLISSAAIVGRSAMRLANSSVLSSSSSRGNTLDTMPSR